MASYNLRGLLGSELGALVFTVDPSIPVGQLVVPNPSGEAGVQCRVFMPGWCRTEPIDPTACSPGYHWNGTYCEQDVVNCPPGQMRDANGQCVLCIYGTGPDGKCRCPAGQHLAPASGTEPGAGTFCVPDACPPGATRDAQGICQVKVDDQWLSVYGQDAYVKEGDPLPSWIDPALGIKYVHGYGATGTPITDDSYVFGDHGWLRWDYQYNTTLRAAVVAKLLQFFPGAPKTGGCTKAKWPLASCARGDCPSLNFSEEGKPMSAALKRYYDLIVRGTREHANDPARAQRMLDGTEPFLSIPVEAMEEHSRPGVKDGKSGQYLLNYYHVFCGTQTGNKVKLVYFPSFDKDFEFGISWKDIWATIIFPPYALFKITVGLVKSLWEVVKKIWDELKGVVCGPLGAAAAEAADLKYPGVKVAHALLCMLLGGGDGKENLDDDKKSSTLPLVLIGVGVLVVGSVAVIAAKRKRGPP